MSRSNQLNCYVNHRFTVPSLKLVDKGNQTADNNKITFIPVSFLSMQIIVKPTLRFNVESNQYT